MAGSVFRTLQHSLPLVGTTVPGMEPAQCCERGSFIFPQINDAFSGQDVIDREFISTRERRKVGAMREYLAIYRFNETGS